MTKSRNHKRAVRAAMASTGENYTRARRTGTPDPEQADRSILLGTDPAGTPIRVAERDLLGPHLLVGATGSGWTVAAQTVIAGLLDLGWSGLVLDPADAMGNWCRPAADTRDLPYQELCASAPHLATWFDACAGLDADAIRNLVAGLSPIDEYWQRISRQLLDQVVNLAVWAHRVDPDTFPAPTLRHLGRLLSASDLTAATQEARDAVTVALPVSDEDFTELTRPSAAHATVARELGAKLALLHDNEPGRTMLAPATDSATRLDAGAPGLTYVGLDAWGRHDLTQVVAAAMLHQLAAHALRRVTGQLPGPAAPRFVVVTGAAFVPPEALQALLVRARSAQIAVLLCTQDPHDWTTPRHDRWHEVRAAAGISIVLRPGTQAGAELCANHLDAGGEEATQSPSLTAARLRNLATGDAVVKIGADPARVHTLTLPEPTHLRVR